MSERGVFAVDRGIFTNAGFADEPFTEREAFLWLVAEAAWKERRVRSGAATVTLQRGQLCHSVRFMADAWQWSKSRVDRFLVRLEGRGSIVRTNGTLQTVLSLCNFEEFQRSTSSERDTSGTDAGQIAGQTYSKRGKDDVELNVSEKKENLVEAEAERDTSGTDAGQPKSKKRDKREYTNNNNTHTSSTTADRQIFREAFWSKYPKRQGSNPPDPAEASYLKAIKNGATHEDLAAGLAGYAAECRKSEIVGTRFVAMASTWLNQGRWKEHVGVSATLAAAPADPAARLANVTDDEWMRRVGMWQSRRGYWPWQQLSEPPDHPRTKVPVHILAKFGIVHDRPAEPATLFRKAS